MARTDSKQIRAGTAPAVPASGFVNFGVRSVAGFDYLATRSAQGAERIVQSGICFRSIAGLQGANNSGALIQFGQMPLPTNLASPTIRYADVANRARRAHRMGYVSAAIAASITGYYYGSSGFLHYLLGNGAGGGGFEYTCLFVPSDGATVPGARMFVGLTGSSAVPTNVEPSTLTDQIGVAQISASNNLQIVFGGSTPQTPIDLGANFPAGGLSTDLYRLMLTSNPNDSTKVGWRVDRIGTAFSAEGVITNTTPGTTLPSITTGYLQHRMWRTNNASALAVGIDLVQILIEQDF